MLPLSLIYVFGRHLKNLASPSANTSVHFAFKTFPCINSPIPFCYIQHILWEHRSQTAGGRRTQLQVGIRGRRAWKQKKKAGRPLFLRRQPEIYAQKRHVSWKQVCIFCIFSWGQTQWFSCFELVFLKILRSSLTSPQGKTMFGMFFPMANRVELGFPFSTLLRALSTLTGKMVGK